jgi:hypothetical protein
MIDNIQTTITALSTFPDRPNYKSARAYATAVATWLRENKELSLKLAALIPELNTIIQQINSATQNIEDIETNIEEIADVVLGLRNEALGFKNLAQKYANEDEDVEVENGDFSAKHWALKAYTAVATLPIGTLIDTLIQTATTWSSAKIKSLLDLKADKSETYTKTQVDTNFQEKLVSGVNLKTVNNVDLQGSGDLKIDTVPIGGSIIVSDIFSNYNPDKFIKVKQSVSSFDFDFVVNCSTSLNWSSEPNTVFNPSINEAFIDGNANSSFIASLNYNSGVVIITQINKSGSVINTSVSLPNYSYGLTGGQTAHNVCVDDNCIYFYYIDTSNKLNIYKVENGTAKLLVSIPSSAANQYTWLYVRDNWIAITNNQKTFIYKIDEEDGEDTVTLKSTIQIGNYNTCYNINNKYIIRVGVSPSKPSYSGVIVYKNNNGVIGTILYATNIVSGSGSNIATLLTDRYFYTFALWGGMLRTHVLDVKNVPILSQIDFSNTQGVFNRTLYSPEDNVVLYNATPYIVSDGYSIYMPADTTSVVFKHSSLNRLCYIASGRLCSISGSFSSAISSNTANSSLLLRIK